YVLTTNFLLTVKKNNERKLFARSVQNISELNRKLTWEKLEIERRYWLAKNVDWKVITNKELPKKRATNIEWVRESLLDDQLHEEKELSEAMIQHLLQNRHVSLKISLNAFDKAESLKSGIALYLFRYLI